MNADERHDKLTAITEAALDRRAEDIVVLDVRELTSFADTFVIVSASSDRRARSIADSITEAAKQRGDQPLGVEGYDEGRWVLVDLGDTIVHIFQEEVRREYDLERLWSDAPVVEGVGGVERAAAP